MGLDKFELRKLDKKEFHEVSKLIWNVFSEFEAPEYSNEGMEEIKNGTFINTTCNKKTNFKQSYCYAAYGKL